MSRFPAAFRLPAFASRSSDSRRGVGPSLRSAYRHQGPDPDGVTTFHTHELRPGWVPPIPRGRRCSSRPDARPRPAPAASQRPVPAPRYQHPIERGSAYEASTEVHAIHPSGLPLACGPRMERAPLGFPPSFAPRRSTGDARQGGDGPSSTSPELRLTTSAEPPIRAFTRNVRPRVAPKPSDYADIPTPENALSSLALTTSA